MKKIMVLLAISIFVLSTFGSNLIVLEGSWDDNDIYNFIDPNKVRGDLVSVRFVRAGSGFKDVCGGRSIDDDGDNITVMVMEQPGASLEVFPADANGTIPWTLTYKWDIEGIKYIYVYTVEDPVKDGINNDAWLTYVYNVAPRNRAPRMEVDACITVKDD